MIITRRNFLKSVSGTIVALVTSRLSNLPQLDSIITKYESVSQFGNQRKTIGTAIWGSIVGITENGNFVGVRDNGHLYYLYSNKPVSIGTVVHSKGMIRLMPNGMYRMLLSKDNFSFTVGENNV